MKVLYVVGTNLSKNTSANISHNAYVQGLLENNCDVDILMATESWGEKDSSLPIWKDATYFTYNSVAFVERFKTNVKKNFDEKNFNVNERILVTDFPTESLSRGSWKSKFRSIVKKSYDLIFKTSDIYNLEKTWLKNAVHFKSNNSYDVIISNSSPAASHKLVLNLLTKNNITTKRWIQIWEDPWFYDLYGGHNEDVKKEEHQLLKAAQEIYYVSPLTLKYQQLHFPDCASKMKHIPLPYLKLSENKPGENSGRCTFGYFGDYYSKTRNLKPFYEAVLESGTSANIFGDSDIFLRSNEVINICGRVTLDKLTILQEETDVLVHLCNLEGGQIPGKIYHYSATTKPILFILDGTSDEIMMIRNYFEKYNRYHFCENKTEEILKVIKSFLEGNENFAKKPVLEFQPGEVVLKLLNDNE